MKTKTPRFDKAYTECLDDTGNITRLEPLYKITEELETELAEASAENERLKRCISATERQRDWWEKEARRRLIPEVQMAQEKLREVNSELTAESTLASATGSGETVIESIGEVDGCDATAQTISVKISTRPSGVRLGDVCWLKWQRHPLPHNADLSNDR